MNGVIITGPTGAVGMALIEKCMEQKISVLAICHRNSKRRDILPKNSLNTVIELDLPEYASYIPEVVGKYDTFFHLAWEGTYGEARNNLLNQEKNIRYTLDAVNLAKRFGCKTFVGAGSQAEYGRVDGILKPNTPAFPENGYGIAKLCAGQMSRILCKQLGIRHIWTRILSIYGPHDKEYTMVMSILKKNDFRGTGRSYKGRANLGLSVF
ncbi:MAG: NAD-dependent epimerase/dehydratase family protein [Lachnospiraceae bacterium]